MEWMNKARYAKLRRGRTLAEEARTHEIEEWTTKLVRHSDGSYGRIKRTEPTVTQAWVSEELTAAPEEPITLRDPRPMPKLVLPEEWL